MPAMKAVQVSRPGGDFELVQRDIPEPGPGWVRIKVEACGVCHSDMFVKEGAFPGIAYPRVPGHEVVGRIDKLGDGVGEWQVGQRVGVGWHGGHCFVCDECRRGSFITCRNGKVTGISFDGGYQEYMVAPHEAVAALPEGIDWAEAAPLLCAGITTYNALRHSVARGGDLVVVQGIGGLGHLGVQYAKKLGFRTVAVSSGADKRDLALRLGADDYIDAAATDPVAELNRLGGARVILATAPNSKATSSLFESLGPDGQLLVVGADIQPLAISPAQLIGKRRSIQGWPSGDAHSSEDVLNFSLLTGVRPMIETFPLEEAAKAYERMMTNKARFRAVLKIG